MRSPLFCFFLLLIFTTPNGLRAESPVDKDSPLETVRTEFGLADGPAWNDLGTLFVPDVKGQELFAYNAKKETWRSVLKGHRFSATFFNHGSLYLADNAGAQIVRLNGKSLEVVARLDESEKPTRRPNDLVVDNQGGIYVTLTRQNEVAYITPEGDVQTAVTGIETSNGLILSPDESTLYVAAYVPKEIWKYSIVAPGKVGQGERFAVMDDGDAKGADGMSIDRAGNVYCAGATDIWIWSPSGELLDKIPTPTRPINCAFGDADMQSLYITGFGGVYRQRMKVAGRSPQPGPQTSNASNRPSTAIPETVHAHLDVVYATYGDRKLLADLFVPHDDKAAHPAILVVHGGGWLKGDKTKFRALAIALAQRGYTTAAIEYRLGGEAPFPAAIQDCHAAVRFLRAHAEDYRVDSKRIGAVGGSAGGHLVGLLAATPHVAELHGNGGWADRTSALQAAIVMAGPLEMTTGSVAERSRQQPEKSNSNRWLRGTIDELPELYKLADAYQHISDKTPPMLFMVGEKDNPSRNEPAREKLRSLGVWTDLKVYKDGHHGCWNQLPWFNDMVADMDTFFRDHLQ